MFYSEDECVMSYFWSRVNEVADSKDWLCASCVEQCIDEYGSTPSLQTVLKRTMTFATHRCFRCLEVKPITFSLAVHPECAEEEAGYYAVLK